MDIKQGTRVQFNNLTEGVLNSSWELLKPLNSQYSTGTPYGLTSLLKDPVCYFYNAGHYEITLVAESENHCKDTLKASVVYLPKDEVRSFVVNNDAAFVDEDENEESYVLAPISVYPTAFNESLFVSYNDEYSFSVYDEKGVLIASGNGFGITEVNTSDLLPGAYLIKVKNRIFKCIKY